MDSEIQSLCSNKTWTLVELPSSHSAIPSRWQYKAKRNKEGKITRFKAIFVAKGFKQKYGVEYHKTYAPVVRYDSLRK
jgi:histone deacetylase 1/2